MVRLLGKKFPPSGPPGESTRNSTSKNLDQLHSTPPPSGQYEPSSRSMLVRLTCTPELQTEKCSCSLKKRGGKTNEKTKIVQE